MSNKHLFVGAVVSAASIVGIGGTAFAGEVTGNGKQTPIKTEYVAASDCAFSGLEDGWTLVGFDENGAPILVAVESGPGIVQTPHGEPAAGVIFPPGVAGLFCRGNASSGL
jgi:hypothetical protein